MFLKSAGSRLHLGIAAPFKQIFMVWAYPTAVTFMLIKYKLAPYCKLSVELRKKRKEKKDDVLVIIDVLDYQLLWHTRFPQSDRQVFPNRTGLIPQVCHRRHISKASSWSCLSSLTNKHNAVWVWEAWITHTHTQIEHSFFLRSPKVSVIQENC